MNKEGSIKWLVIASCVTLILLATFQTPTKQSGRDQFLATNFSVSQLKVTLTPDAFCRASLGSNFGKVNCDTADNRYLATDNAKNLQVGKDEVTTGVEVYAALLKKFRADEQASKNSAVIANLERKMDAIGALLKQLPKANPGEANRLTFEALLIEQGYSYNPYANKFKKINHNIARYAEGSESVSAQLDRLDYVAKYFGVMFAALAFVTLLLLSRKVQTIGLIFFALFLLVEVGSFIIVRDAAQNYALGLPEYGLNPFRESLERQASIMVFATLLAFVSVAYGAAPITIKIKLRPTVRDGLVPVGLLSLSLLAYMAFGPAIGSETLKLIVCLICAAFLARFGRSLELLFDTFGGGIMRLLRIHDFSDWLKKQFSHGRDLTTGQYLYVFLMRSVLLRIFAIGTSILVVTTVFGDLGGALIALLIFFFSLYLLLGVRFALSTAALFCIASVGLYIVSAKVQSRVQLMLEPMHANVSDFGRLLQFESASQPHGYGLGLIKWCSNDSVCIPLQSLSDYMPTIVNASLGSLLAMVFYVIFVSTLLFLAYKTFMKSWVYGARNRAVGIFAALLCMSALFQLLITLMGNLRVMPLTGLGLPLMSIGISSFISVSLGMGLAIGTVFKK